VEDLQITPADIQQLMQESPLAREQLQRIAMARALAASNAELNALKSELVRPAPQER
jgi:hypothetical protein